MTPETPEPTPTNPPDPAAYETVIKAARDLATETRKLATNLAIETRKLAAEARLENNKRDKRIRWNQRAFFALVLVLVVALFAVVKFENAYNDNRAEGRANLCKTFEAYTGQLIDASTGPTPPTPEEEAQRQQQVAAFLSGLDGDPAFAFFGCHFQADLTPTSAPTSIATP